MRLSCTTTKAHICLQGGTVLEIHHPEALIVESTNPFKGNMSPELLKKQLPNTAQNESRLYA